MISGSASTTANSSVTTRLLPIPGRLKPGGRVDDVTRSHSLAGFGTRPEVDQGLTGVHGDPNLHRIVLAGPVPDRERCSHRTFRIVLVCNGRAEESHHRIADELLH